MVKYISDTEYDAAIPELHVDGNCYFNSLGTPIQFSVAYSTSRGALGGIYRWDAWRALTWTDPATRTSRALGFDAASVLADPQFLSVDEDLAAYDPASSAFRPADGSPCAGMGAYAGR